MRATDRRALEGDLRAVGVCVGDHLLVHASIKAVGEAAEADAIIDALTASVGPTGTIVIAAYHYDFTRGVPYNPQSTPSQTGRLAAILHRRPGARRTGHPIFNFVVLGARADEYARDSGDDAFGAGSVFDRLCREGGKVLLLGVDYQNGFTFIHYAEQVAGCPHRVRKEFRGSVLGRERVVTAHVRAPETVTWVYPMGEDLDVTVARRGRVGDADCRLLRADVALEHLTRRLNEPARGEGYSFYRDDPMNFARRLWPLHRSLTGAGTRNTLELIGRRVALQVVDVPSGTRCFDWTVPFEWELRAAELTAPTGDVVVAYPRDGTLSVVGYSEPFSGRVDLDELQQHLYSVPEYPAVTPYVTSYYAPAWGFCLPDAARRALPEGHYAVKIDAEKRSGAMPLGVVTFPTTEGDEQHHLRTILFSTNTCHPSLAVNELSGLVVLTALAEYVRDLPRRRFRYEFLFVPETIGALAYLAEHLPRLKRDLVAGFTVSCVPQAPKYRSLLSVPSATDDLILGLDLETCARHGDERQYAAPGVRLPVTGLYALEPADYPSYHTSRDNLERLSEGGFREAIGWFQDLVDGLERALVYPRSLVVGEPHLTSRGLYPTTSDEKTWRDVRDLLRVYAECTGEHSIATIAARLGLPWRAVATCVESLEAAKVVALDDKPEVV